MYTLEIITPPTVEPVTLQDVKDALRLTDDYEDDQITQYITAARMLLEARTGLALLPTTFRQWLPKLTPTINIMKSPVSSVASVRYYDESDTLQTLTGFVTETKAAPATLTLPVLPSTNSARKLAAYVEFVAGYVNAAAVPAPLRLAIKLVAAHWYANREAFTTDNLVSLPLGFDAVCHQYRVGAMGSWEGF